MTLSMAACGSNEGTSSTDSNAAPSTETGSASNTGSDASADGELSYAGIVLGESYTDITTTIHVFNQRTDMAEAATLERTGMHTLQILIKCIQTSR